MLLDSPVKTLEDSNFIRPVLTFEWETWNKSAADSALHVLSGSIALGERQRIKPSKSKDSQKKRHCEIREIPYNKRAVVGWQEEMRADGENPRHMQECSGEGAE